MSKIAFFCIPAHGHTNPTLPVVRELIARGHQVRYYSYEPLREKIEASGAEFIACDKYDQQTKFAPEDAERLVSDLAFSTELIVNTTLAMDDALIAEMKEWQPDCIVADSVAFWGKLIALKLGIPFVCSNTTFAFNRYSAKILQPSSGGFLKTMTSMAKANKHVKRLQAKGYPVKNVLSIIASDDDTETIVYTSKEFQPFAETFSDKYTFVGPSVPVGERDWREEKAQVYISLGTVLNDNLEFYRNCIEAFGESMVFEVVMSVGEGTDIKALGEIPDNFTVAGHIDQIAVLQKADVFLTHCGMNSVNEALYFEVPLVMYPLTTEESGVALRVSELGAGMQLKENSSDAIRTAVAHVAGNIDYRLKAREISQSFRACGGPKLAADKILEAAGL